MLDNLPKSVRAIVELVGIEPALALVGAFPGLIVKVPKGSKEDGVMMRRLVGLMGLEAAEKFIGAYGGEVLPVPRCVKAMRDARDLAIIADYDAGKSVRALVIEYALTERQLRSILKRSPGEAVAGLGERVAVDDKQLGLF